MTRCPRRCSTTDVNLMLMAFGHYRSGFLPDAGGWAEQAYLYTEAMRFIDGLVKTHERQEYDG